MGSVLRQRQTTAGSSSPRSHWRKAEATEENVAAANKYLDSRIKDAGAQDRAGRAFVTVSVARIKVNELLDDLVTEYKRGPKSNRVPREASPQMLSHLKRLRAYFGMSNAVDVTKREIDSFVASLKSEGKKNATINRSLQLLHQAYRIAVESDPPKATKIPKIEKLDESDNVRKGKFLPHEVELVASSLPSYMADVARFAYATGARAGEILKMRWDYINGDGIDVPGTDTKNREARTIAITEEMEEVLSRRRAAKVEGCDLIFHHDGQAIIDYRKCWHTACVTNGLGHWEYRECHSRLAADRKCPKCEKKSEDPKYIGRLVHDLRRKCRPRTAESWSLRG